MKAVTLSAICTGRLYPQVIFLVLIAVKRLSRPRDHSAAGRMRSMQNSSDPIGNRTRASLYRATASNVRTSNLKIWID